MQIRLEQGTLQQLSVDVLLLVAPDDRFPAEWTALDELLQHQLFQLWKTSGLAPKELPLLFGFDRVPSKKILLAKTKAHNGESSLRLLYAKAARKIRTEKLGTTVALTLPGLKDSATELEEAVEGFHQGSYLPELYKTETRHPPIEELRVSTTVMDLGTTLEKAVRIAQSQEFARNLVNEPASKVTPSYLLEEARKLADTYAGELEVLTLAEAEKRGMGAFCAVASGSDQAAFLLRLHHAGSKRDRRLFLIGKGLTFDSGGLSLKPWESMVPMKSDMAGAATVLGAFQALAQLRPDLDFTAITPLTENLPSGKSFKPGDILQALNGKTIEVRSTDAEGRLILADSLCWAIELGATHIVDLATLTGACLVALGYETVGLFGNSTEWNQRICQAAEKAEERVWAMPMFPEYKELNHSEIADIANSAGKAGSPAGAIAAAFFLKEFVKDGIQWAHLDIAGPAFLNKPDRGYAIGATGTMVRTLVQLGLEF